MWGIFAVAAAAVPVLGTVTGADGSPVQGSYAVTFGLFASASDPSPTLTDTRTVEFHGGSFAASVGDDAWGAFFATHRAAALSIQLAGDAATAPVPISAVPYANWADDAGKLGGLAASAYTRLGDPAHVAAIEGVARGVCFDAADLPTLDDRYYDPSDLPTLDARYYDASDLPDLDGRYYDSADLATLDARWFNEADVSTLDTRYTALNPGRFAFGKQVAQSYAIPGTEAILDTLQVQRAGRYRVTAHLGIWTGLTAGNWCTAQFRLRRHTEPGIPGSTQLADAVETAVSPATNHRGFGSITVSWMGWLDANAYLMLTHNGTDVGSGGDERLAFLVEEMGPGAEVPSDWTFVAGAAPTASNARKFSSGSTRQFGVSSETSGQSGANLLDGGTWDASDRWRVAGSSQVNEAIELWFPRPSVVRRIRVDTFPSSSYDIGAWRLERWNGSAWEVRASYAGDFVTDPVVLNSDVGAAAASQSWRLSLPSGASRADVVHLMELTDMLVDTY